MKTNKRGISLIVLIITIIIVIILAATVILSLGKNNPIESSREAKFKQDITNFNAELSISHANNALKHEDYDIIKQNASGYDEMKAYIPDITKEYANKLEIKEGKLVYIGTDKNEKSWMIELTQRPGISLSNKDLSLELKEGETLKFELSATVNAIDDEITWKSSDDSIATISATTGDYITVEAIAVGKVTITATCGNYSASCEVTITKQIAIGDYVEYDVSYKDMYTGYDFTKINGWRYIGKDDDGNYLIVSTGIPATFKFDPKISAGGIDVWFPTKQEISESTSDVYRTDNDYGGDQAKYAAYGLRYKFTSILFKYQASGTSAPTANEGIYRQVGNYTSGNLTVDAFKANVVDIVDVHNLTLAELNRARNKEETSTTDVTIDGATGLFYLKKLVDENPEYNYTSATNSSYCLATPSNVANSLWMINQAGTIYTYRFHNGGVRPVVVLPADVQLIDTNGDGVVEIK